MMEHIIEQASSYAADIDEVILIITILGGFWLLLAEFVLFYLIVRFRASKNPKGQYLTGDSKTEKRWIIWPHNIVILCDLIIIFFAVRVWYNVKQSLPEPQETVRIVGQQWAWQFTHPGPDGKLGSGQDITVMDELHVKVGKVYHFKLESQDVLHSFSVPVFRLKQDAVPGRVITGWFKPTKEGVFDIQCAEMCGIGHGIMAGRIHIQSEAEYEKWTAANRKDKVSS